MKRDKHRVAYAHGVSKEALRSLWEQCFPEDANGFAAYFLDVYFRPEQACCVLSEDGDTVESAMYWLPCAFEVDGISGTMLYIYAMCTDAAYRRRGNLRAMLEFTENHCRVHGIDGMVLHALDTSKSSVEAFGMRPLLSLSEKQIIFSAQTREPDWCPGTFEDFVRLRQAYLKTLPGRVYWEGRELQFVYDDLCRAGALRFFREGEALHYAVIRKIFDGYIIEECDRSDLLLPSLTGQVTVYGPGQGIYAAHIKTFTKSLQDREACKLYFTLMLK